MELLKVFERRLYKRYGSAFLLQSITSSHGSLFLDILCEMNKEENAISLMIFLIRNGAKVIRKLVVVCVPIINKLFRCSYIFSMSDGHNGCFSRTNLMCTCATFIVEWIHR